MIERIQFRSKEEWLKHRDRVGGSEASALVGCNPYKTNQELWREKTGRAIPPDISDKPYVRYGTEAEPFLRGLFAIDYPQYKVEYFENNMIINSKYPFAHASLDGELTDADGRKGILEIKTTNILQSMHMARWDGKIPQNYYVQLLWYMMVTEYEYAWLVAQLKMDYRDGMRKVTKHFYIEKSDVEEDIEMVREAGERFWQAVQVDMEPGCALPFI